MENKVIGIDSFGLYTPNFYIDLRDLAQYRGVDPDKYTVGIGQDEQAVAPSSQDIVTMGAAAAREALDGFTPEELDAIGLLIVGTETGIDASKASAVYIHHLLGLSPWVRSIEIKEACFGGTAGVLMARDYVAAHPGKSALVIASDIARYGLETSGEVTQGAGSVAMVVAENPRIMRLNNDGVAMSADAQDFWRPVYQDYALARGKFSTELYIRFFEEIWDRYSQETVQTLDNFDALCFHLPYSKMGSKAFATILPTVSQDRRDQFNDRYRYSTLYGRRIGNIYTGSLWLSVLSLLENDDSLTDDDVLGLFSYGSGAVGELFSATLTPGFRSWLKHDAHEEMLDARTRLTISEYEKVYADKVPYSVQDYESDPQMYSEPFVLRGVKNQERQYKAL